MKFTCSKKRYRLLIEPEVPLLKNTAGEVVQSYVPPIWVIFEDDGSGRGYYDTDEPQHVWNQPKNVIKGLGNAKLKERVEYAIKTSKAAESGWIKEWTKPKKFKLVEVTDEAEKPDVIAHQNAVVPSDEMLEADAKRIIDSITK